MKLSTDPTVTPGTDRDLEQLLQQWLPGRRWFPFEASAGAPQVRIVARVPVELHNDDAQTAAIYLVQAVVGQRSELVQIPLVFSDQADPQDIGKLPGEAAAPYVQEAVGHAGFLDAVLRVLHAGAQIKAAGSTLTGSSNHSLNAVSGVKDAEQVQVISAEQSNTSVIVRPVEPGESAIILKFFRVISAGTNPDVEVGRELTELGCSVVPHTWAWADLTWPQETGESSEPSSAQAVTAAAKATGQIVVVTELVDGAADAWAQAVDAAATRRDFTAEARELGRATARMHRDLVSAFGEQTADEARRRRLLAAITKRIEWAGKELSPALDQHAEELEDVVTQLEQVDHLPPLQRIHGDYHLGQVLHGADGAYRILDFEGEPLRPINERVVADLALRDVVGMLRSLDYAAAFGHKNSGADTTEWGEQAGAAFLEGWSGVSHQPVDRQDPVFRALWLDKALYEVVYETRNRPDWVDVPMAAVEDALAGAPANAEADGQSSSAQQVDVTELHNSVPQSPAVVTDSVGSLPWAAASSDAAEEPENTGSENPVANTISEDVLAAVAEGRYYDPHQVLGAHPAGDGTVVLRTLRRFATEVSAVLADGTTHRLSHEWGGIFSGRIPADGDSVPDYRLLVTWGNQEPIELDDPYRYAPTLGELDLHLIGEGRHETLWEALGSHVHSWPSSFGEIKGTSFSVWAPNAQAVRVIGDFNGWDGTEHAMRSLGGSGVWEVFIPGVGVGTTYKYRLLGKDGQWRDKADPMARWTEEPPRTGSRVWDGNYEFTDDAWMQQRAATDPHDSPMSVYEVHIASWRQGLSYRDLATELVNYVRDHGFTHVEFMPVAEHPFGGSWGYQVTGYYAPSSRFGDPDDFKYLVNALHEAGIGVLVDWVPGHFPKDDWALAKFDGEALYEHPDPRRGEHKDWGTLIFDYGRTEVRNFLVANALYWLEEFHIDGLRVDAVASMLYLDYSREDGEWAPNQFGGRENLEAIGFLQESNATAYRRNPGIVMIAEESTAFPGVTQPTENNGLGFGIKWNMGWMHDSLEYMEEDPMYRHYHHGKMTFSMVYAYSENFILPISHDEVVYGKGSLLRKMPGDRWKQLAGVRAYLAFMWAHPGKQLLFMGQEFGQESEWNNERSLDWWLADTEPHRGIQELVARINQVYKETPALWAQDNTPDGFNWLDANDSNHNTLSFVRWDREGNPLVCVVNFAGNPHYDYRVALPMAGKWEEVLNSDAEQYGGSGVGNGGSVTAVDEPHYAQPAHAVITVPPLAALWLRPVQS
ncbi:1,4-alpha-glucan branching protein GlgB [Kocuria sp.]|uniref:1,4-alpha-glucan branching protein GlgB n=1 Tax=Kocuria sp. TaxID=1871328 RepID=UPI0026DEC8DE|nr:1,4-alpha-glucan branching protein GlgB [Kocuria sp.]MDO5618055.1 1,4-alpha-glucan branching protein GlgB [Kocuria sp.]